MQQFRTILAVILSLGVFYVYNQWTAPQPSLQSPAVQEISQTISPGPENKVKPATLFPDGLIVPSSSLREKTATSLINLDNRSIRGVLSSEGGQIVSWILQKFHTGHSKESPLIHLLDQGKWEEALGFTLGDPRLDQQPQVYREQKETMNADGRKSAILSGQLGDVQMTKSFVLNEKENPYVVDLKVTLVNKGSSSLVLSPRLWIERAPKDQTKKKGLFSFLNPAPDVITPIFFSNGKLKSFHNLEKLKPKEENIGPAYWTGLTDRYFLTALISRQVSDNVSVNLGKLEGNRLYTSLSYGNLTLNPGASIEQNYSAYLGPKKRDELMKLGVYLERAVDYGWFSFVAVPILWLLQFFHKIVGNWGVAIIVLTFVIKLLLHPINKKAMGSMKAMQKLQPELQTLREKYKDNKEKLNTEMMLLFKRRQVNPMSGCLPMILQMPIYFALYRVLDNAIELYHAPFFWFYHDLAAPDPYMVSPIILGILMALQQKLTPTASVDPVQQKMMMIMPLMFISFMLFLPSGLVIYILVNTLMSVVQQYMMQHDLSGVGLFKKIFVRS